MKITNNRKLQKTKEHRKVRKFKKFVNKSKQHQNVAKQPKRVRNPKFIRTKEHLKI